MKEKKGLKMDEFTSKGTEVEDLDRENLEYQAQNFIQKNATVIIIVSVVIVAVAGYMFYSNGQKAEKINEANKLLAKVIPAYDQENYEAALRGNPSTAAGQGDIVGLIDIAEQYQGVPTGAAAALLAGNTLTLQGDFEKAAKYFEMATDTDAKTILAGAHAGLGACFENKGSFDKAADAYVNAANYAETPSVVARYNLFAAMAFEKDGNTKKAGEYYNRVVKDEIQSEYSGDAKLGLIRIGMIIE